MIATGAHHTGISVMNIDESIEFYSIFGCEVIWRRDISDEYFGKIVGVEDCRVKGAQLRIPGSGHVLELFEYVPHDGPSNLRPTTPGHAHLAFLVQDLRAAYVELISRGVRFYSEPVLITAGVNAGGYGAYILDPSGFTLELFEPAKGRNP